MQCYNVALSLSRKEPTWPQRPARRARSAAASTITTAASTRRWRRRQRSDSLQWGVQPADMLPTGSRLTALASWRSFLAFLLPVPGGRNIPTKGVSNVPADCSCPGRVSYWRGTPAPVARDTFRPRTVEADSPLSRRANRSGADTFDRPELARSVQQDDKRVPGEGCAPQA